LRLGDAAESWLTIVGVVGDVRHSNLEVAPRPEVHRPLEQAPADMMMLAVRGTLPAAQLSDAVRTAIATVDPAQPVYHVKTLDRLVADSMLPRSTTAAFMVVFGGVALVLAAVGLHGVIAYAVSQQTREFGVRLALGATPMKLLSVVLQSGMLMVGAGILIGVSAAAVVSRMLAGLLFGVSSFDPLTHVAVTALLGITGLVACAAPAWRAAKTTAMSALRAE
jgi:ABC-type antimicrobial peptide transport system permease subunit